ncbi:hypothetical protein [Moorena sp. SIO3H5]|nr:hypothetical protein [Moorena sp. SIO3H5]
MRYKFSGFREQGTADLGTGKRNPPLGRVFSDAARSWGFPP